MNAIVSVSREWGIGNRGRLIIPNADDMRRFRSLTWGGTVICGRTTYESFPNGALPNRRNIVLSSDPSFDPPDALVVRTIDEALGAVAGTNPRQVWVIGGAAVYRQMLPMCQLAYVTFHEASLEADTFFPNLDQDEKWFLATEHEGGITQDGTMFTYRAYVHEHV